MRAIRPVIACLAAAGSVVVEAQEAEPFQTRNLSPPVAIFGLPTWEAETSERTFTFTTELANHYRLSQLGADTLILDGETLRLNFFYAHPVGDRFAVSAELPFVEQSGGVLDDVVDAWHSAFNMPDGGRNNRPEDDLLYLMARGARASYRLNDDDRGVGDLKLGLASRVGAEGGFVARLEVKLPTGDEDILAGSGALDWSVTVLRPREVTVRGRAAGYYWGVGWLDIGAPDRPHYAVEPGSAIGILGGSLKVLPRVGFKAQIDVYTPMYDTPLEEIGQNAVQATIGAWWEISAKSRVDLAVGEDLHVSTAPDVVLHASVLWRW